MNRYPFGYLLRLFCIFSIPARTRGRAKIVKIATSGASGDGNSRGGSNSDSGSRGGGGVGDPIKLFRK